MPTDKDSSTTREVGPRGAELTAEESRRLKKSVLGATSPYAALVLLAAVIVTSAVALPAFATAANLTNILTQQAVPGIVALGLLGTVIAGEFDLSAGMAVSGALVGSAYLMSTGDLPWLLAILIACAGGAVLGVINGLLVAVAGFDSIVATLATGGLVGGGALVLAEGRTIFEGIPSSFTTLGHGTLLGMPKSFVYLCVLLVVSLVLFHGTSWGREHYAIGAGRQASKLAGLKVTKHIVMGFVITGVFGAIGGVVLLAQLGAAPPNAGTTYLLSSFAAVFLGSTILKSGVFNVAGTIIAVFLIATATNSLSLAGVPIFVQQILTGTLLLGAVGLVLISGRRFRRR